MFDLDHDPSESESLPMDQSRNRTALYKACLSHTDSLYFRLLHYQEQLQDFYTVKNNSSRGKLRGESSAPAHSEVSSKEGIIHGMAFTSASGYWNLFIIYFI